MVLIELQTATALAATLASTRVVCVSFSARWCGPCKASRPLLEKLALKYADILKTIIVYEADIGDVLDDYKIDAFPTYVFFVDGIENGRVEGSNMAKIEEMMVLSSRKK